MKRVLLDTNVLVSAALAFNRAEAPPFAVLNAWFEGRFLLLMSAAIEAEFRRTMAADYFRSRIDPETVAGMFDQFRAAGERVNIEPPVPRVATHPEDDLILAAVLAGGADYLVTGDRQLLALGRHGDTIIVSIAEFLAILDAGVE